MVMHNYESSQHEDGDAYVCQLESSQHEDDIDRHNKVNLPILACLGQESMLHMITMFCEFCKFSSINLRFS
jgi:hypothetical protein